MLHIPLGSLRDQAISFPTTVTGEFLAKNRLSKRARAQLAADIISGKVRVADFTIKQAAALCSVSVAYINEARAPDPAVAKLLRDWNEAVLINASRSLGPPTPSEFLTFSYPRSTDF